jgi:hypothetical protein
VKLGFICDPTNNAYYRAVYPMLALERRGHTVVWPEQLGEDVPLRMLSACDLVHCYRSAGRIGDLRRLSKYGVAITFDNDDNYAAAEVSDGGSGLAGHRFNRQISRAMLKVAIESDLTTTPSGALADIYRTGGVENLAVIENHLDRSMFGFGRGSPHDGVVVGWIAGVEHRVDLERVPIVEALRRLLDMHSALRVLSVGVRLPLRSERYEHIAEVPFPQLLKVVKRIDIGVAPLADIPFNHSRSSVKLKEYASGEAAWLASPVGPYRGLGEKQGGRLVADDGWLAAIDELIRARRLRRRLAKRALKWAEREAIDNHAESWETAFEATLARVRSRAPA